MPYIQLTQGKRARVDAEDFKRLNIYPWHAVCLGGFWYAIRNTRRNGKWSICSMHREILGLKYKDGKHADHINHDGLDNRQYNLRICTRMENNRNNRGDKNTSSIFKGVSWSKQHRKWSVRINADKKQYYLGRFESEIEAARVYNQAALKYHGKFAYLNVFGKI